MKPLTIFLEKQKYIYYTYSKKVRKAVSQKHQEIVMKRKISIVCLLTAGLLVSGVSSCSSSRSEDVLKVCVYDGGYGLEWIEEVAKQYKEKTGITVEVEGDTEILSRIESQLRDGSDYDIFMSQDINWKLYAANGYLAELDDLYASTVEGTGKTFEERLVKGAKEISKDVGEDGVSEHYYKVCYTQGAGGLVYNVDLFKENGWNVPTTYDELVTLCETISNTQIPGERENYSPFAWSGKDRNYYWDYLVFPWWYELAGEEKINTILEYKGSDGKYSTGYEMYNPSSYYKEFIEAYNMWYKLVATSTNNNSMSNAYSASLVTAQGSFASGKSAMIPYGQWAQYEIENANKSELGFEIRMMKTPKAKASSSEYYNYNVGFGDSMIIPANSPYIEEAKDFLRYLATYEACETFAKYSKGAFLAFDYSDVDISALTATDPYTDSIYDLLTECKNFNLVSSNPIAYWNTNTVMPWIQNVYYYAKACQSPSENTPEIVGNKMYTAAKNGWSSWLRNANLSD